MSKPALTRKHLLLISLPISAAAFWILHFTHSMFAFAFAQLIGMATSTMPFALLWFGFFVFTAFELDNSKNKEMSLFWNILASIMLMLLLAILVRATLNNFCGVHSFGAWAQNYHPDSLRHCMLVCLFDNYGNNSRNGSHGYRQTFGTIPIFDNNCCVSLVVTYCDWNLQRTN